MYANICVFDTVTRKQNELQITICLVYKMTAIKLLWVLKIIFNKI